MILPDLVFCILSQNQPRKDYLNLRQNYWKFWVEIDCL